MKKLLILVGALAIGSSSFAATAATAKLNGTVKSYDAATQTLTVSHSGKDSTFKLADQSQVIEGKSKTDASVLATGKSVKVEYIMNGATKVAEKVEVSTANAVTKK